MKKIKNSKYDNVVLRKLETKDVNDVMNAARNAFYNLYMPGADEHLIINNLLKSELNIKELNYVLEVEGKVVGACFYSKAILKNEENQNNNVVCLGPVFIDPMYQKNKLGLQLIEESLELVKALNYDAVFLYGYPSLYSKVNFEPASKYNIANEEGQYPTALQVFKINNLIEGQYIECFDFSTDEKELEEFDKQFETKEKKHQKSQDDFLQMLESFDK